MAVPKTQVVTLPDGRSRYRFKHWQEGQSEPAAWDVEGLEEGESGALCLVQHNANSSRNESLLVWARPSVQSDSDRPALRRFPQRTGGDRDAGHQHILADARAIFISPSAHGVQGGQFQ